MGTASVVKNSRSRAFAASANRVPDTPKVSWNVFTVEPSSAAVKGVIRPRIARTSPAEPKLENPGDTGYDTGRLQRPWASDPFVLPCPSIASS
jgi:hypothetical protein